MITQYPIVQGRGITSIVNNSYYDKFYAVGRLERIMRRPFVRMDDTELRFIHKHKSSFDVQTAYGNIASISAVLGIGDTYCLLISYHHCTSAGMIFALQDRFIYHVNSHEWVRI